MDSSAALQFMNAGQDKLCCSCHFSNEEASFLVWAAASLLNSPTLPGLRTVLKCIIVRQNLQWRTRPKSSGPPPLQLTWGDLGKDLCLH